MFYFMLSFIIIFFILSLIYLCSSMKKQNKKLEEDIEKIFNEYKR